MSLYVITTALLYVINNLLNVCIIGLLINAKYGDLISVAFMLASPRFLLRVHLLFAILCARRCLGSTICSFLNCTETAKAASHKHIILPNANTSC